MQKLLNDWLAYPLTKGLDIDDPQTTELRRQVIQDKKFLYKIYCEWYEALAESIPAGSKPVLEIGSGAGFLENYISNLITSEIFYCSGLNLILDGRKLPFQDGALKAIAMSDVLHHIPKVRQFLAEAARCVEVGGVLVMIEPWVTPWSRFIYTRFHHEPFTPDAKEWHFPSAGPLSCANGALPWIIFGRDRERFQEEFPVWKIQQVTPHTPFRYLISGGISKRCLMPNLTFGAWKFIEDRLSPHMNTIAMFARIVLVRI